jgi:hypothetical protein
MSPLVLFLITNIFPVLPEELGSVIVIPELVASTK